MLNDTWDKCLLVKGWKSSAGWGFPKGKINEQEPRTRCAAREVLEETGYDLEGQIVPDDVIELSIKEQSISLYIVPGVPEDYPFKTRTRKEISKIAWFRLSDLPTWKRSKSVPGKFYLISPFIVPLKAFIHDRKPLSLARRTRKAQNAQIVHDMQFSSEDDSTATLQFQSSLAVGHDTNAQESSSQSSSADNGEPVTPSPQYSAPIVNHAGESQGNLTGDQPLNFDGVDPQLARLLSSLSMSASAPHSIEKGNSGSSSSLNQSPSAQAPDAQQRILEVASVPPPSQSDWSSRAPAPSATLSSSTRLPMQGQLDQSLLTISTSYLQGSPSNPSHVHHQSISRLDVPPTSQLSSYTSLASQPLRLGSPSAISPRSHARRSSATADISPYLSRARNVVPTGKEMRYISLLENVVKESDRAPLGTGLPGPPLQSGVGQFGDKSSIAPPPSASVPPMMMGTHGIRMGQPVIYSSSVVAPPPGPQVRPPTAFNIPPTHGLPGDDPFTVRPHTSNNFHTIPPPPTRPGMYVDPTRRVNPGIPPMGIRQPAFGPPPSYPSQFNPAPPVAMQMAAPPPRDAQTAFRVIPPHFIPPPLGPNPGQLLASTMPTSTLLARNNASRAANNAQLLSILNTPSTARAGPIMMTPDVRSGVGPR